MLSFATRAVRPIVAAANVTRLCQSPISLQPSVYLSPLFARSIFSSTKTESVATRSEGKVLVAAPTGSSAGLGFVRTWIHNFITGERMGVRDLNPIVFGAQIRPDIMHRVVVFHLARIRAGTASTKSRGEVSGSTRKMYQQKGSGRARRGSKRAPGLKGGGRAHGPKPRDFSIELPKKVLAMGVRSALSAKLAQNELVVVGELQVPEAPKTRWMHERLSALGINTDIDTESALILVAPHEYTALTRAAGNLPRVLVQTAPAIQIYDVLRSKHVVLTPEAVAYFEDHYAADPTAPPSTPLWLAQ
eukprot:TRINITY_DN14360_c0_g1_i1.p1 TRINITY_DN14360_c0_g1~~TRINITY_DN14360_c0_g1_i1.p1  ORF type:complete len:303 (-),score=59.47 TRINITY_DN14360_c0_g1_i1:153-1061(-)